MTPAPPTRAVRAVRRPPVVLGLVVLASLVAACGSSGSTAPTTSSAPGSSAPPASSPSGPTTTAPSGTPPAVPGTGAYLGAWVHPAPRLAGGSAFAAEQQALPAVRAATGRSLGILHLYVEWNAAVPVSSLRAIAAAGSIPMLDWGCGPDAAGIAQGTDDAQIATFAQGLRAYGGPVLLRWCWEMNLVRAHPQIASPSDFVAAWVHLRSQFSAARATNVSFVWCPALSGVDPTPYYPGDAAVDWIGIDGYDRDGTHTFTSLFGAFYGTWVGHRKPLVVAETGAGGSSQPDFIASIGTGLPTLPGFKGVVWFDAPGPAQNWAFTPAGLQAFAALARNPYFAPA